MDYIGDGDTVKLHKMYAQDFDAQLCGMTESGRVHAAWPSRKSPISRLIGANGWSRRAIQSPLTRFPFSSSVTDVVNLLLARQFSGSLCRTTTSYFQNSARSNVIWFDLLEGSNRQTICWQSFRGAKIVKKEHVEPLRPLKLDSDHSVDSGHDKHSSRLQGLRYLFRT